MFAQVVFPLPFRNEFTYTVPDILAENISIGQRVVVPFGKRTLTGFVVGLTEDTNIKEKIKPIRDILDPFQIFNEESLKFYKWISDYYLCSVGEALKNSVPYGLEVESKKKIVSDPELALELFNQEKKKTTLKAKLLNELSQRELFSIGQLQKLVKKKSIYSALNSLEKIGVVQLVSAIESAKVGIKTQKFVKLNISLDEAYSFIPEIEKSAPKQVVVLLELLSSKTKELPQNELLAKTKTSASTITSLVKKGILTVNEKEIERRYVEKYSELKSDFKLTSDQKIVIDSVSENILNSEFASFLLHGVTGSGKTQVYIELVKLVMDAGKSALILVPEISLTPQITSRFFNNFGDKVAVLHSRMSIGERYDSWRGIASGKYSIVIGPRSALFAPLKNTGIIIVDEEHDQSYKQHDITPRYHARDSAVIKAQISSCPVLLGSATPSIESMQNAENGKYKLLRLNERVDNAKLPKIEYINITIEKKKKRLESIFAKSFLDMVADRLNKKEGVILLQNRRGFATNIFCEDCGEIVMCPDCTVSMVHHIKNNVLKCHYCGITQPAPKACTICGSINLKFFGTGTQKVEDELAFYFPEAKIERVDSDTMNRKGRLSKTLNDFSKGEIDILVGTQMVSKGLDFSNVTLVGVISAETSLWIPDYRADERTFQLLTQVAGRAGRSEKEGLVLIQTQKEDRFVLKKVLYNDYRGFYESELDVRRKNGYPPFTKLCLIETKDENESRAQNALKDFHKYLKSRGRYLQFKEPTEAVITKLKRFYRFHLVIKSSRATDPSGKILRQAVLDSYIEFNAKSRFRSVRLIIDIDPGSII
ncbi:MAG: primosomal protein N' [Melioribacteraceae bacterium]|nr:primosomal protein N' [Melioribacteraceae bacterium]MCF8263175.1 primosomal protein N' [Melioribacteraceae bacterium]MCF8414047.1 primosomal protein N' [Melioribacteraceae bacterium]MCF8430337.1 primosomal protein N' [Melioribacteraceae bacterium]